MTFKKQIHKDLYMSILQLQRSYLNVAEQLSKQCNLLIPKTEDDVKRLGEIEQQVQVAQLNYAKLEEIKYWTSLTMLTDGALVSDDELTAALCMVEELYEVAQHESNSPEQEIAEWAKKKLDIFEKVNNGLYAMFDHKKNRKEALGEITIQ